MRRVRAACLVAASCVPAVGFAEGRYQAISIPEMLDPGTAKVFVIDTESGHLWTWTEEAASPTSKGGRYLIYQGQLRPGRQIGDVISAEEWGTPPAPAAKKP